MRVHVADHPLIAHKLTYLRDKRTDSPTFRRLAEELMTLLAYEATREVRVEPFEIETPVAPTTASALRTETLIVPILRAGLGIVEAWCGCCRAPRSVSSGCSATRRPSPSRPMPTGFRGPHRSAGLRPRPDARDRRLDGDAIQFLVDRGASNIARSALLAARTCHPAGPARRHRPAGDPGDRLDRRAPTSTATSCRGWATPAIGSTASSDAATGHNAGGDAGRPPHSSHQSHPS